jgi:hypothetical protein
MKQSHGKDGGVVDTMEMELVVVGKVDASSVQADTGRGSSLASSRLCGG